MPWKPSIRLHDFAYPQTFVFVNRPELTVKIPRGIVTVEPDATNRLLEKQWRAASRLKHNPYAWAMNMKWRKFFRACDHVGTGRINPNWTPDHPDLPSQCLKCGAAIPSGQTNNADR